MARAGAGRQTLANVAVSITGRPFERGLGLLCKAGLELILIRTIWLFPQIGVLLVGVLSIRALDLRAPDF